MTKLTDTQAIILSKAAQHPDGLATPPESLPPAPRGAVAKRLLEAGLVEITVSAERQDPGLVWKLDGQAVFLRITPAGLRAIGVAAEEGAQGEVLAASDSEGADTTVAAAERAQDAPTGAQEAVGGGEGLDAGTAPQGPPAAPQDGAEGAGAAPLTPPRPHQPRRAAQRPPRPCAPQPGRS